MGRRLEVRIKARLASLKQLHRNRQCGPWWIGWGRRSCVCLSGFKSSERAPHTDKLAGGIVGMPMGKDALLERLKPLGRCLSAPSIVPDFIIGDHQEVATLGD